MERFSRIRTLYRGKQQVVTFGNTKTIKMKKLIKTVILKAEVNDNGYAKINTPSEVESSWGQTRESLERMGIEPNPHNCSDFDMQDEIELDPVEDFNYWATTFYFNRKDFKTLDLDFNQNLNQETALLTLRCGAEYIIQEKAIKKLLKKLNKG